MEVLQTEVKTPLPLPILAVYFEQYDKGGIVTADKHAGGIVAADKEVQCVIDTINDGTLYLRGAHTSTVKGRGAN